ncbi:hypothetical protein G8759_09930 [Spirosoma aureum]|uniref:Uncharacterized protein n=1 Tax=Spirosoma aureum TaxID=2692134 RepID=A0A6G9AKR5_9BACT|nr:hypothetical protein [Spirosoma aureum]QIP12916.1 hypothetical protein G8759_09930 [Spirosoma aureum]
MKPILILLMLVSGFMSLAQSSSTLNTVINEDGKVMSIQVDGERNGRAVKYDRTFDVTKLSSSEKDALKNRVLDSLGIGQSISIPEAVAHRDRSPGDSEGVAVPAKPREAPSVTIPKPPVPPIPPADAGQTVVTFRCESCTGKVKLEITSPTEDYSIERDAKVNTDKRLFPYQIPLSSGEYNLKYYQNGVLQIQSKFTVKSGETNTVVVK